MGNELSNIQLLENTIKNLYPENEYDAYEYLMYYLSICLYDKPTENILLILNGNGSNGKSFLLDLIKETFDNTKILKLTKEILLQQDIKNLLSIDWKNLNYYSESTNYNKLNINTINNLLNSHIKHHHLLVLNSKINYKNVINEIDGKVYIYNFKYNFCENPIKETEKKQTKNILEELSNQFDIKETFKILLKIYYDKLQKGFSGNIMKVPKQTMDKENIKIFNNKLNNIHYYEDIDMEIDISKILLLQKNIKQWLQIKKSIEYIV